MQINPIKNNLLKGFLSIATLILLSVVLIVWFLPRNKEQQFRYDIGRPWVYGPFIAKFDFPVYKTDETIKKEQDSLLQMFMPYYNYSPSVEATNIARFNEKFKDGIPNLPKEYKNIILNRLHRLYQAGIIYTKEYNEMAKDSSAAIRIVAGKEAQSMALNCIYSTMSAYEQLLNDESLVAQKAIIQRADLNDFLEPNLIYDRKRTETEKADMLSSIAVASGIVVSGQKIIDRGEIVDDYTYRVLNSFEREMHRRNSSSNEITRTLIGQVIFVFILVGLFTCYLAMFRRDYFYNTRNIAMLYTMITLFPILVSIIVSKNFFSVYIIPFAMVPIFTRVFMDTRTAFLTHTITTLLCAAAVKYQFEFIIVQLVSGMAGLYSLRELSQRSQILKAALVVTLSSAAIYFALQFMQDDSGIALDHEMYYHFIANGVLLLLAYPLMYLIEKTFGFISDVTLFELSDTNKSLIREMSEIAPGTFQHSITVANLAAAIANKIGANSLLLRTGALYHDIGKMISPAFFTENQAGNNPHNNLPYKESARIIISHVTEGVRMAEKHNLPQFIKDFILTHHGEGLTKYFYIKYQNEHPDEEVDKAPFQYPGPNPFTREQAILMMTDTVEAASRSLPEYTEESISNLVNTLIDDQVNSGYFTNCPITFKDIAIAKQILIERLKSIYHTRVSYPKPNN